MSNRMPNMGHTATAQQRLAADDSCRTLYRYEGGILVLQGELTLEGRDQRSIQWCDILTEAGYRASIPEGTVVATIGGLPVLVYHRSMPHQGSAVKGALSPYEFIVDVARRSFVGLVDLPTFLAFAQTYLISTLPNAVPKLHALEHVLWAIQEDVHELKTELRYYLIEHTPRPAK